MPVANAEIARQFREMADLLQILDANPFRVRAYENAARVVEAWTEPVAALAAKPDGLQGMPGIGADLAGKIEEIARTGTFTALEEAAAKVPRGILEILRIPGLGPKKARTLHEKLGIASLGDLAAAAKAGKIRELPGFSFKSELQIIRDLGAVQATGKRFLRAAVAEYVEPLIEHLRAVKGVTKVEAAGSFRRRKDTVGNADLVAKCEKGCGIMDAFTSWPESAAVIARSDDQAGIRLRSGLEVRLTVVPAAAFGLAHVLLTGSTKHIAALKQLGEPAGGRTEEEVYDALGLAWIPPELRENRGEIELAAAGDLPELIEQRHIRGDLQMHTVESDGKATLEQMAEAAELLGYSYIAVTDHSPLLSMVQGLDAAGFRRQWKRIDALNAKLKKLTVLKAAEVDIREDGELDLPDDVMAEADLIVVSLHSKLRLPAAEQTRRVVRALSHPSADIFGHPTGRKILTREGARFAMAEACKAAADHGVMMEINSEPDRLDLDEAGIAMALERGVKLVISTDAHAPRELLFMRWGVDQARRGGVRREDVANTRPLAQFRKLLHGAR